MNNFTFKMDDFVLNEWNPGQQTLFFTYKWFYKMKRLTEALGLASYKLQENL